MNWKKLYNIILPLLAAGLASYLGLDKGGYINQPTPVTNEITFNAPSNNGEIETIKRKLEALQADVDKWHK